MKDLENYYLPHLQKFGKELPILDFGSGHGRVINFLKSKGFKKVSGYEKNRPLVDSLDSQMRNLIEVGDDPRNFLKNCPEKFKAIVVKDVIYYFPKNEAISLLQSMKEKMLDKSILIMEIFNGSSLFGAYVKHKDFDIQEIYTEHSIQSLLDRSGYSVISMQGMQPSITGIRSFFHFLASRLWIAKLKFFYWLERGTDDQNPRIFEKKIIIVASPKDARSTPA